jgi:hypothetical protein
MYFTETNASLCCHRMFRNGDKVITEGKVQCALIVPLTDKCWPEDGLGRDRNM